LRKVVVAVCGALNLRSKMRNLSEINLSLNFLNAGLP